jgi:hypothetical protein
VFKPSVTLYSCATLFSLVLGMIAIFHEGVINPDGILYVRVAQIWLEQGMQAAVQQYSWPFYGILIGATSRIFFLSPEIAAYFLNLVFQILITVYFIRIIGVLGGSHRAKWFALFVILFFPHLLDYRAFIIRDLGYWAGYLAGLFYLLSYCRSFSWKTACFAVLALGFSSLFRVEGILFLLLMPFAFMIIPRLHAKQRLQAFACFSSVTLILVLFSLLCVTLAIGHIQQLLTQWHFLFQGVDIWRHSIAAKIDGFANQVLDEQSRRSASYIVISGLLGYFFIKLVKVINPLYLLLTSFGWYRGVMPASRSQLGLLAYFFLVNMLVMIYFVGIFFFLSGRYLLPMVMIAIVWVPFTLDYLYLRIFAYQRYGIKRAQKFLFIGLMVLMSFIGLHNYMQFGERKRYLYDAGEWFTEHLKDNESIITNSAPILFYAKGSQADWQHEYKKDLRLLLSSNLQSFDYVALRLNKHSYEQLSVIARIFSDRKPVAVFENGNKEKVLIY